MFFVKKRVVGVNPNVDLVINFAVIGWMGHRVILEVLLRSARYRRKLDVVNSNQGKIPEY